MQITLPSGWVLINGVPHRPEQATVSVFDRGFLYGDSVFETMRAYRGVVLDVDLHLERLERSAGTLGIELSADRLTFRKEIAEGVALMGKADLMVRVMHTRGVGPVRVDPTTANRGSRIVMVTPLEAQPPARYELGLAAALLPQFSPSRLGAEEAPKTGNYLYAVLASARLSGLNASEGLLADEEGRIVEGVTSNLFWVADGCLWTPPPHEQVLSGVTQRALLECARALGLRVEYAAPSPSELLAADEVMISSSLREVMAVVSVDGHRIGQGAPGPIYRALLEAYRQRTERYVLAAEKALP